MKDSPPRVVVVAGPTASGKTAMGIELAQRYNGEIVSADSMQIYRHMDIGTAKATPLEQAAAVHHMIDILDPREGYSAARYVQDASACCDDILRRGKLPIIVGGTGLYIDSLLSGRDFASDNQGDRSVREALSRDYDRLGGETMLQRLAQVDPERAALLPAGDKRRIVRALEIFTLTGMTITRHDALTRQLPPRYNAVTVLLCCADRSRLYRRIDARVDAMVEQGLFCEVESLLEQGVDASCTSMQAIGYKECVQALRGEFSRQEAVERIKQGSRRYAKRQVTWFGRNTSALHWEIGQSAPELVL